MKEGVSVVEVILLSILLPSANCFIIWSQLPRLPDHYFLQLQQ